MAEDNSLLFGTDAVATPLADYNDDNIRTLSGTEHIRLRPGMYIGRLGDGSLAEDGIYVLLKEVIDNSIDEFKMKAGDRIEVNIYRPTPGEPAPSPSRQGRGESISIRDYGRGIPQGKMIEAVSVLNTGGKYDSKAFKKSIGLNGVGVKAVNALSSHFEVHSYRDGQVRKAVFERGKLVGDTTEPTEDENGTYIYFEPDDTLFQHYKFHDDIVETMLRNYTYLNTGLAIMYNGRRILSRRGLEDLLKDRMTSDALYPIIHLQGEDIEIAFTHANQYGEEYYSFVNGQHTTQGGTHQSAFKEHIAKTIKEFFQKNFEYVDIRAGIVAAIALNVEEPMFESQTKIKLGSLTMAPVPATVDADHPMPVSINKYVGDFIKQEVDNYLHKHSDVADVMLQKIQESEKERKAIAGVTKLARERAKKASLHNRKLRDCRIHYSDTKNDLKEESCIFITEGDSASGSITKSRDVNTQAVFSLRGKPLNTFGLTKKVVYENEEFNLLQAALDIEDGLDTLRYNKVIVATDADVDGMHIRLLIITFFLQFFPELIRKGHVYVLQTPLFRVRNKRSKIKRSAQKTQPQKTHPQTTHPQPLPAGRGENTSIDNNIGVQVDSSLSTGKAKGGASDYVVRYCYSEEERLQAISDLGPDPEITRFKGLGEISPEEFAGFIGPDIRLEQVTLHKTDQVQKLLEYYMGKNTMERQNFIIDNLVIEEDRPEEEE
ncbi:MAG: type IIA DNA topoisomerase subunit B [Prevotella sp.]|nr:type IIA DNA topoisomerase subunit B [Prevotella sp.]